MTIHPKTSGAAVGSALGVLIVAVLQSFHGVHLAPELPGAITGFLAILGAWFAPGNDVTPVTSNPAPPAPPVLVPPAPPAPPVA